MDQRALKGKRQRIRRMERKRIIMWHFCSMQELWRQRNSRCYVMSHTQAYVRYDVTQQ
jgi:hypothetical protein